MLKGAQKCNSIKKSLIMTSYWHYTKIAYQVSFKNKLLGRH